MATVSRTKVPWASVVIYSGLTVLLVVIPYFAMHGNAVSIYSDEAGIGTVPILVVYLLADSPCRCTSWPPTGPPSARSSTWSSR